LDKLTIILEPKKENIKKAALVLKKGGLIIYPTESSYAIGCDFTNDKAVEQLCKVKNRKKAKHLTVIVPDIETAKKYGKIDKISELLVHRFMPGPLTLAVAGKGRFEEFNFRISSNHIALKLAKIFGKPIVATSANISGEENIYDSKELAMFFGKVDVIIDAGMLPKSVVSTVAEVKSKKIRIHREGAIPVKNIIAVLKSQKTI
jgi:tRNA threonylcarbamoyl adenosine modification protein (Sua5/YciO/YrdC/YwlC family)